MMRLQIVLSLLSVGASFGLVECFVSDPRHQGARGDNTARPMGLLKELTDFIGFGPKFEEPAVMGDESIMKPKTHGTSSTPVQGNLRWNCDRKTADNICNFNRHYAEHRGYWTKTTFFDEAKKEWEENGEVKFYDSNTGQLLFVAPRGRTFQEFIKETLSHGWPSFRDEEVLWDKVRVLNKGECVSVDGTHLGHDLPDSSGNRYCINLVSVAGRPVATANDGENDGGSSAES
mmetsp:Transcript_1559/g.2590  ORF Transcript_1559/g.2590 Transcript_1559/m.2590 type:complete len:232 (-) Transcript_1559:36-731(-)